jgi:hypothetical protein
VPLLFLVLCGENGLRTVRGRGGLCQRQALKFLVFDGMD